MIEGEDYPGEILSFLRADEGHWRSVKAIPRITSKVRSHVMMCGREEGGAEMLLFLCADEGHSCNVKAIPHHI